jgi:hypothetical protein
MRTVIIIVGGLVLFGLALLVGRWLRGTGAETMVAVAKVFLPIWLIIAAANMWMGVARAGYTMMEELPIFAVIFAIPAAVAGFVWWKYSG